MSNTTMSGQSRRLVLRSAAAAFVATAVLPVSMALAAEDDTRQVETAVTALKDAMLSGDGAKLKALTLDQLTYGHSNARLEDKAAFVASLDGKNAFKSIDLSDQTVQIVGDVAVVRHTFDAVNNLPDGKTSTAHIKVLQVWKKADGSWKLLARQAAPLPA